MAITITQISSNLNRYGALSLKKTHIARIVKIAKIAEKYVNNKDDPKAWDALVRAIRESA